jgi:tRNA (guanine-N7-)-methyltransferase
MTCIAPGGKLPGAMRFAANLDPGLIAFDPAAWPHPIPFDSVFGSPHPGRLELEIGSGKGTFLCQEAAARPLDRFLGVEYDRPIARYAQDRLRRAGLINTRLYAGDAHALLIEAIGPGTFDVIHVYFPDPWPKKRHHKRRLIQAPMVAHLSRCLKPGGILRVVTDHAEYAEQIDAVLAQSGLQAQAYTPTQSAREGELVGTNFERKYKLRDARPCFAYQRRKTD